MKKFEGKKQRIFKKMPFSWEGLLNADKRQQIAKTLISIYMFALLEMARIYKGPKAFYWLARIHLLKDPKNKGINLIVY